jgi:hypothetical protein
MRLLRHVALAIGLLLPAAAQAAQITEVQAYVLMGPVVAGYWCGNLSSDEVESAFTAIASMSELSSATMMKNSDDILKDDEHQGKGMICSLYTRSTVMGFLSILQTENGQ